jgi:CheY-like chemotaxis protein
MARVKTAPVVLLMQRPDDRAMYEEFFRHHGLAPLCPADATEALACAPAADVLVTGLMLPGVMDGFEFIERLRADARTKHKPIIVVTSWAWQTERLRARDAGCDVFLTKPCLPDDLLREIRRVLAATRLRGVRGRPERSSRSRPDRSRRKA